MSTKIEDLRPELPREHPSYCASYPIGTYNDVWLMNIETAIREGRLREALLGVVEFLKEKE